MPTILTHAAVPLAIGLGLGARVIGPRLLAAGVLASMAPDLDVIAFRLGIAYGDVLGHRGWSHSLAFACLTGLLAMGCHRQLRAGAVPAFLFVTLAAVSHGLLDMFTNGGRGVALLWPVSAERLFFPWQVIEVSPLTLARLFSERGLAVMLSELSWVWLPACALCAALALARRWHGAAGRERRPRSGHSQQATVLGQFGRQVVHLISQDIAAAQNEMLEAARHIRHIQQRAKVVHKARAFGVIACPASGHAICPAVGTTVGTGQDVIA